MFARLAFCAVLGATLPLTFGNARAATSDSERIEERLPAERKAPAPTSPATTAQDTTEADFIRFAPFVLRGLKVENATMVDKAQAEACANDFAGKTVGPIELYTLTQCVTRLYRDEGYFLSRAIIPPQEVEGGTLTIRAIEGYIAAIVPTGIDQADADTQFADALSERPAKLATFERGLMLLADRYGYTVKASQLVADPNDGARYTYKMTVEVRSVAWRAFADNRGTDDHGPEQVFGWVAWNSLFGATDRLAASIFTTPTNTNELVFVDVNYARGWWHGVLWSEVGASMSRADDKSFVSTIDGNSDVDRIYGRLTVPIVRTRAQSLWSNIGLDVRNTDERDAFALETHERTRVLRGSLSYTIAEGSTRADVMLDAAHGLDAFGASQNGDDNLTRSDGRPQFTKVRVDAALLEQLSDRWQLAFFAAGQKADGALVGSEEFGGGGSRFGRAYDYSEVIGDDGAAVAMEVRWTIQKAFNLFASLQLYAFADALKIWNAGEDPGFQEDGALTSLGGGLRLTPTPGLSATVEAAKPLAHIPSTERDRSPRVFVSLSLGW